MSLELNGTTGVSLVQDGVVVTADLADSAITTAKLADTSVTTAKLDSDVNSGVAKAWVNFDGTGTPAIRRGFNVSSITDLGTGRYTITFTTAMVDVDYCVTSACSPNGVSTMYSPLVFAGAPWATAAPSTTAFSIVTNKNDTNVSDTSYITLAVFR